MGSSYSCLEKEKVTWNYHCMLFDEDTRTANLDLIHRYFPNDSEIQLRKVDVRYCGLDYQHFFICDAKKTWIVELSGKRPTSPNADDFYCTSRVQCNTLPYENDALCKRAVMTPAIRERMAQMMGMCNYSLCLRNSEHVANYIFSGLWASFQMEKDGKLLSYFNKKMTQHQRKKINIFPSAIAPRTVAEGNCGRLYSMIDRQYTATGFQYFSNGNSDSYNILVVGPTGAGKSRLINVLFNSEICDSYVSHQSITRDVCFIDGHADIVDMQTSKRITRKIVVADTVGLCDTEWDDDKIFDLLKGRVSRNFTTINAVFIVFRADRLSKEHVKNIGQVMKWLKYEANHLNFLFVGTFSENLTQDDKNLLKKQFRDILKLKDTKAGGSGYEQLVYVGFPPEDQLNDTGKNQVKASWDLLQPLMRLNDNGEQFKKFKVDLAKAKAWYSIISLDSFWKKWQTFKETISIFTIFIR